MNELDREKLRGLSYPYLMIVPFMRKVLGKRHQTPGFGLAAQLFATVAKHVIRRLGPEEGEKLLKGAIEAREKVGMKMNVPRKALDAVARLLPSEKSPTVSSLADPDWVAIEVIVEERVERELVPQLKRAGATGIITYPLNKVIP